MKKKWIIFDFDGTIADTLATIIDLINQHVGEYHIQPLGDDDVISLRMMTYSEIIKKYNIPLVQVPFLVLKLHKELRGKIDQFALFPKIKELLCGIKKENLKLGILTSNSAENVKAFLKINDIEFFDFIHSELNLFGKDKALKKIMKEYGIKIEEAIYVGDELRDIDACKKIGMEIISVSWGFNKREILEKSQPTYLVDKPEEISRIVLSTKF